MSTLRSAYADIFVHRPFSGAVSLSSRFTDSNHKGIVTIVFISALVLGALQYAGSVSFIFALSFQEERHRQEIRRITDENNELELRIQQKKAMFFQDHKVFLESMEKISEVKYVVKKNVAVSSLPLHP